MRNAYSRAQLTTLDKGGTCCTGSAKKALVNGHAGPVSVQASPQGESTDCQDWTNRSGGKGRLSAGLRQKGRAVRRPRKLSPRKPANLNYIRGYRGRLSLF